MNILWTNQYHGMSAQGSVAVAQLEFRVYEFPAPWGVRFKELTMIYTTYKTCQNFSTIGNPKATKDTMRMKQTHNTVSFEKGLSSKTFRPPETWAYKSHGTGIFILWVA